MQSIQGELIAAMNEIGIPSSVQHTEKQAMSILLRALNEAEGVDDAKSARLHEAKDRITEHFESHKFLGPIEKGTVANITRPMTQTKQVQAHYE